jgi:hypothetical protein
MMRNTEAKEGNKRTKRPRIGEAVRSKVRALHRQDLGPSDIQAALKKNNGHAPSLRTINTILEKARNVEKTPEFQRLQQQWHLGLLEEYPMPAEAIAVILTLLSEGWFEGLSVRHAVWISRLYRFLPQLHELIVAVSYYSQYEYDWQLSGKGLPADTAVLDRVLLQEFRSGAAWGVLSMALYTAWKSTGAGAWAIYIPGLDRMQEEAAREKEKTNEGDNH